MSSFDNCLQKPLPTLSNIFFNGKALSNKERLTLENLHEVSVVNVGISALGLKMKYDYKVSIFTSG